MQQHQVTFIGESDLPAGQDWAPVRDRGRDRYDLFIKPWAITPDVLMDCWEAFLAMEREGPVMPVRVSSPCELAYSSSSMTPTRSM